MENEPIKVVLDNNGITSVKIPIKEYFDNRSSGEYGYYDKDKTTGSFKLNDATAKTTAESERQFETAGLINYLKEILDISHQKAPDAKLITFVDNAGKETSLNYAKGMEKLDDLLTSANLAKLQEQAKAAAFDYSAIMAKSDNTAVATTRDTTIISR